MDYLGVGGAKGMLPPSQILGGGWPPAPPPSFYAYEYKCNKNYNYKISISKWVKFVTRTGDKKNNPRLDLKMTELPIYRLKLTLTTKQMINNTHL